MLSHIFSVFLTALCVGRALKNNQLQLATLLLVCVLVVSLPLGTVLAAADDCTECHSETVDRGKGHRYVHAPFMRGDCSVCHVVGSQAEPPVQRSSRVVEREQREKIDWFRDVRGIVQEHWILVPEGKVAGSLYYKAWDGQSRTPLESLNLPALTTLPAMVSELDSPVISNVRVVDVRRGVSTAVTIRWETDEFTDAEVLLGRETLNSSSYDGKLSREHQMVLVGLDADAIYQFQVVAQDLFGNRSESEVVTFKTDRTFIEQEVQASAQRLAGQEILVSAEAFRHQQSYLLVFKADRPVSLTLGVERQPEGAVAPDEEEMVSRQAAAGTGHPLLKSRHDTNITACYNCHSSFKDSYSHPVNVFPRPGMVIPPEYPLLPDGRISCMSCHSVHGADIEYRLLKDGKRELCRGCHRDY